MATNSGYGSLICAKDEAHCQVSNWHSLLSWALIGAKSLGGRRDAMWEKGFEHYQEYLKEHKHCNVPKQYKSSDGYKLGLWVSNLRQRRSSLSSDRLARLDAVGFDWDPIDAGWEKGFSYLKMYKEREGHCSVPGTHKENGFSLGQWVTTQRKNQDGLPVERRQAL